MEDWSEVMYGGSAAYEPEPGGYEPAAWVRAGMARRREINFLTTQISQKRKMFANRISYVMICGPMTTEEFHRERKIFTEAWMFLVELHHQRITVAISDTERAQFIEMLNEDRQFLFYRAQRRLREALITNLQPGQIGLRRVELEPVPESAGPQCFEPPSPVSELDLAVQENLRLSRTADELANMLISADRDESETIDPPTEVPVTRKRWTVITVESIVLVVATIAAILMAGSGHFILGTLLYLAIIAFASEF